jgi:sterol desaturase/sphingolipid hydroxylase (fatty acid hydroxylase superfamily)
MSSNSVENMPRAWVAPTEFLARFLFTIACLGAVDQWDLVAFWGFIEVNDGWVRFHARHHALLTPVMTVVSVSAFFINR